LWLTTRKKERERPGLPKGSVSLSTKEKKEKEEKSLNGRGEKNKNFVFFVGGD